VSSSEEKSREGKPSTSITLERLAELLKAEFRLSALESGGVDAWDWYGDSLDDAGLNDFEERLHAAVADESLTPDFS
jgi:hypothetical protein